MTVRTKDCLLVLVFAIVALSGCRLGRPNTASLDGSSTTLSIATSGPAGSGIRLMPASSPDQKQVFSITHPSFGWRGNARKVALDYEVWSKVFPIRVSPNQASAETWPAILGTYFADPGRLSFEPRFSLQPGVTYRAEDHPNQAPVLANDRPSAIGRSEVSQKSISQEFSIPARPVVRSVVVRQVYPTINELPENQLKFYIHFSAPMSRGQAYDHIRLLDSSGTEVQVPFLELGEELWDPACSRFTLFFDPGRVKRELQPRREMGPALENGKEYTLVVSDKWLDAGGNPLVRSFQKKFRVGPPDYTPIDAAKWTLNAPRAATRDRLAVRFPEPLDHALLRRMLWVIDANGHRVTGEMEIEEGERGWTFSPANSWKSGTHRLVVQTALEDLAGNNIGRAFEFDIFKTDHKLGTVSLPFEPRKR